MNAKDSKPLSVSQLSNILKACFENPMFSSLTVYGEVYSIRLGKFSYIDLGDQGHKETNSPLLRCAFNCYYGNDYGLEDIKVGDIIQITGSLSYYPHGSSITLWGKKVEMLLTQSGKSLLEKKKTLEKLDKLGYLDPKRKRAIPRFCKRVAILTAETGAAYQDIKKTLHDRFPVDTVLFPTVVQGSEAANSIVKNMKRANASDFDVIILGRGGGSKTDLSCFDDEKVAFAIAESGIPVITCIGHTIDTAIADRVSDAQAITPTEGASLINPSLEDIHNEMEDFESALYDKFASILNNACFSLEQRKKRLDSLSPLSYLKKEEKKIESLSQNLNYYYMNNIRKNRQMIESEKSILLSSYQKKINEKKEELLNIEKDIEKYNPDLYSGYALIMKDDKRIKEASELTKDDDVTITFIDGRKEAKIK